MQVRFRPGAQQVAAHHSDSCWGAKLELAFAFIRQEGKRVLHFPTQERQTLRQLKNNNNKVTTAITVQQ